jgi:hypothetical protein
LPTNPNNQFALNFIESILNMAITTKQARKSRKKQPQRSGPRVLSITQLERLRYLELLPDSAVLRTRDAALLAGCSLASWERRRQLGLAPGGLWINGCSLGFNKGVVVRHREEFAAKLKRATDVGERQYPAVPIHVATRRKRSAQEKHAEASLAPTL